MKGILSIAQTFRERSLFPTGNELTAIEDTSEYCRSLAAVLQASALYRSGSLSDGVDGLNRYQ
jgi:hypothetical protein